LITNVKIEHAIGKGNFGEVYKGIWQGATEVALKQLSTSESDALNEIKLLKELNHPNIVRYFGVYKSPEDNMFVMMEFMALGDVSTLLRTNKDTYHLVDLLSM
jgi:serine/threonine protein kinase